MPGGTGFADDGAMHWYILSTVGLCLALSSPNRWHIAPDAPSTPQPGYLSEVGRSNPTGEWVSPPYPTCESVITLESVLPNSSETPDRLGEWVELRNGTQLPVDLTHFFLVAGKRRIPLDGLTIEPGSVLRVGADGIRPLGSLMLRNKQGCVELLNPCDRSVSVLRWLDSESGIPIQQSPVPNAKNPRSMETGGGFGGCGQT